MSKPTPAVETHAGDALLAELADDFVRRHRAGERPSVDEYASNHPELADRIRDLFPAMMAMEQPDLTPPVERLGATIGRYKLLERLGEGGFGVVFMAEQQHPVRRKVALKIIKAGMDTRQVIARFEAERQALALMEHANIAKVLDAGATESGRPYFVMELVRGVPITDYCDQNQLPPRQRLELFVQVCRAVQHAHTKGIIHRDIKPTNVLVTLHDGVPVPKVIDFGVAKATGQQLTEKTLFTQFAQMVGTPLYMSPEQAEMSGLDVDTRSDIYSLGVLLYELLTGTTPVDKDRLKRAAFDEVRRIIREEEPPRPSTRISTLGDKLATVSAHCRTDPKQLGRLVRGELDWIVMRALEKDRTRRYETANGLARDVERYLHDEPVEACPPSATYRVRKLMRRYRGPLAVAAGFVLLLAVASVVSTWLAVRATNAERQVIRERDQVTVEKRQKETALIEKQAALAQANRNERTAQERLAAGLIFAGHSQLKSKQGAAARQSFAEAWDLSRTLGQSQTPALCGILQTYAVSPPPLLGVDETPNGAGGFDGHAGPITVIEFSADGRHLVTGAGGKDRALRWWDLRTGASVRELKLDGSVRAAATSPDGDMLFVATSVGRISAVIAEGQRLRRAEEPDARATAMAVSPDGRWVLTGGGDGAVKLWDAATLREIGTFKGHLESVHEVVFHPHLPRAFSSTENGKVGVWEIPSGKLIAMLQAHDTSAAAALCVSPDGRTLVTGSIDNTIRLWDAQSLAALGVLEGHAGGVTSVAFSPDGRRLVSASRDRTIRLWDVASGREIGAFTGHRHGVRTVRFSGDGRTIISGDDGGRIKLWTTQADREIPSFGGHADRVISVAFSRDQRVALSGSFDKTVRLWDLATGKQLRTFDDMPERIWAVALSPNSRMGLAGGDNGLLLLLNLASGTVVKRLEGHTDIIPSVAFLPDGRSAISASSDGTLKLWDVESRELLHTFKGHGGKIRGVAVSSDGALALSAGSTDRTIKLWSIPRREHLRDLVGHRHWVMSVAFSPDDSTALSGSWDHSMRLWDLATGKTLHTFDGHSHTVLGVAFAPDGRTAASASYDHGIDLWDLESGAPLAMLSGHDDAVTSIAFAPGELTLFSASREGRIKVWDVDRPRRYQQFFDRLATAREALRDNPADGGALEALGEWYAFRGADEWSVELLERARAAGADVPSLMLARGYWRIGRMEKAEREFQSALRRNEAPRAYLELCLSAVTDPPPVLPATLPASQPSPAASEPARR